MEYILGLADMVDLDGIVVALSGCPFRADKL